MCQLLHSINKILLSRLLKNEQNLKSILTILNMHSLILSIFDSIHYFLSV